MYKKNKLKKKRASALNTKVETTTSQKEESSKFVKLRSKYLPAVSKTVKRILLIASIISALFLIPKIMDLWKTPHEKYVDENFVKGIFIPDLIQNSNGQIIIRFGSLIKHFFVADLLKGVEFEDKTILVGDIDPEPPFKLKLLIKNNRIYINTSFIDIEKYEEVGRVNYSKWSLFKPNLLDYYETDSSLEVLDRERNVIFFMNYVGSSTIDIRGYHVGRKRIYVVTDYGLSIYTLEQKQAALKAIQKLIPKHEFE